MTTDFSDWSGFIKCDFCNKKISVQEIIHYNDLQICESCKKTVYSKSPSKINDEGLEYKKNIKEKQKKRKVNK